MGGAGKEMLSGVDGLHKELNDMNAFTATDFRYEVFQVNASKNRYRDVVCLDVTRVVLTLNLPPEGEYIHVNRVKLNGPDKQHIATHSLNKSKRGFFSQYDLINLEKRVIAKDIINTEYPFL